MSPKKPNSEEQKRIEEEADAVIEVLLKKFGATPEGVFEKKELLKEPGGRVLEKALAAELTHHLGYRRSSSSAGQKKCGAAHRMTERPRCSPQNSE